MSGGFIRYAHLKEPGTLVANHYDAKLRKAADAVAEGRWWTENLDRDERAALVAELELLADDVEEAREEVRDKLCSHHAEELLRAIDYCGAGDYGPDALASAWEQYREAEL